MPYPLDSGCNIRGYNILRAVAESHEIDFLSFDVPDNESSERIAGIQKMCSQVTIIPRKPQKKWQLSLLVLKNLFEDDPLFWIRYRQNEMKNELEKMLRKTDYDAIHCEHLHMAGYLSNISHPFKILDAHQIETILLLRYVKQVRNIFKKNALLKEAIKLKKWETKKISEFSAVLTVSRNEQEILKNMGSRMSVLAPNGVDLDYFNFREKESDEPCIVFTGSLAWEPNVDAVLWYYKFILPFVKDVIPDVRFLVVGQNPPPEILALTRDKSITITGYVPDIRPFLAKGTVFAVPLRIGGGTRLKILQAFASGIPVLSTSIGAEGIEATPDKDIIIKDDIEGLIQSTISLLQDGGLRKRISQSARLLVETNYDWVLIRQIVADLYKRRKTIIEKQHQEQSI